MQKSLAYSSRQGFYSGQSGFDAKECETLFVCSADGADLSRSD